MASKFDTVMFTILMTLMSLPIIAFAADKAGVKLDAGVSEQELANANTVKVYTKLCKDSGCKPCGLFRWDEFYSKMVNYSLTQCEIDYDRKQQDIKAHKVDEEIRKKYDR